MSENLDQQIERLKKLVEYSPCVTRYSAADALRAVLAEVARLREQVRIETSAADFLDARTRRAEAEVTRLRAELDVLQEALRRACTPPYPVGGRCDKPNEPMIHLHIRYAREAVESRLCRQAGIEHCRRVIEDYQERLRVLESIKAPNNG
jgi:hypothetical protein